jgi:hypothetical protein
MVRVLKKETGKGMSAENLFDFLCGIKSLLLKGIHKKILEGTTGIEDSGSSHLGSRGELDSATCIQKGIYHDALQELLATIGGWDLF